MKREPHFSIRHLLLFMAVFGALGSYLIWHSFAAAPDLVTVSQGGSHSLSPDFFGFNNGQGQAGVWTDPAFIPALNGIHPETIRGIIGGTTSDYLNWQTGQEFISSINPKTAYYKPNFPNPPFLLSYYVNGLKAAHAAGVFNLNIMTYCPVDNSAPTSTSRAAASCTLAQACGPNPAQYAAVCNNTDYTWGLDYQIAMLKAAQSMGVPIKYIELGNELYIANNPDYAYYFPTPEAYVNKANAWIPVLKKNFPGAEIAIVGQSQKIGSQETVWNQTVLSGVHGEDAVTFHTYYGSQIPNGGTLTDAQNVATILSKASQAIYAALQNADLSLLPPGVSAWITEWNLWSDNLQVEHGSWAQGLTEANYAVNLVREPRIGLVNNHSLVAPQVYGSLFSSTRGYTATAEGGKTIGTPSPLPTTQLYGKTGGGFALSALTRSLHGATSTAALTFSPNPVIAGTTVPGLVGQSFMVNGKTNLYFANLSNQTVTIGLGGLTGYYSALQYASDPANFVTGDSSIPATSSIVTDTLTIPGYSVSSLISEAPPPKSPSATSGSTTISTPSAASTSTPSSSTHSSAKGSSSTKHKVTISNSSAPEAISTKAYIDNKVVADGDGNQVSISPDQLPTMPNGRQTVTLKSTNPGGSISVEGQTIYIHNSLLKNVVAHYQENKWLTVGTIVALIIFIILINVFHGIKLLLSLIRSFFYRLKYRKPGTKGQSPPPTIITPDR